jgi:hypothetical protein
MMNDARYNCAVASPAAMTLGKIELAPAMAVCSPKYTGVSKRASASRLRSDSCIGTLQSTLRDVHWAWAPL